MGGRDDEYDYLFKGKYCERYLLWTVTICVIGSVSKEMLVFGHVHDPFPKYFPCVSEM